MAARGAPKSQAKNTLKKFKKMFDRWPKVCYTVLVMSEQSYLTKPSGANARMDIAGVEGSLSYIVENIGTEWCDSDDITRILTESMKILEGARQESRDSDGKYDEWIENA